MKFSRLAALVLAVASMSAVAGSTVYTCKTDQGTVYQDHPCATAEATMSAKTVYAPRPCGSNCGAVNGDAQATAGAPSERRQPGQSHLQAEEVSVESVAVPSGFQCSGNGKTWVQAKPCPDSVTVYRPIFVSGNDQYGNHITGSGTMKDQAPISQQGLSHDELCNHLHELPPISKGKNDPSADTYERNKMRQQEGC